MRSKRTADLVILAGLALASVGLAAIWWPLALILGGLGLAAFGLLFVGVKP
jgi:nitrogen fixation-related uncharacterized protein